VVYVERSGGPNGGLRAPVGRDGGGGSSYEMHAPSHPQAVNQYIKEFNYNKPQNVYCQALQAPVVPPSYPACNCKYHVITTPVSVIYM